MDISVLTQQFFNALTLGAIYALIALGYTMVYGIIELINFAHGDVFTVGAFLSMWLLTVPLSQHGSINNPLLLAGILLLLFAIVMPVMGLLGVGIERFAYRPLRNAPRLAPLLTAIGVSFMLQNAIQSIFGPSQKTTPRLFPSGAGFTIFGAYVSAVTVFIFVIALVLIFALQAFIARTRLGRAMRSTAQDREAAQLMGVNINRTIALTFFIGSALAGAGGIVFGLYAGPDRLHPRLQRGPQGLHGRGAGRHRQHHRRGARRILHRLRRGLLRAVRPLPLVRGNRVRGADPRPRLPAVRPARAAAR